MTTLVNFNESHLGNTFLWMQDTSLKDSFLLKKEITKESHLLWYEDIQKDQTQKIFSINYMGIHCGNCGLKNINYNNKNTEYWMYLGDKELRGKGIAQNAVNLLVEYCFRELLLHKVYIHVGSFNEKTIHLHKKCGFEVEGFLKDEILYNNQYISLYRMAILNGSEI